MPSPKLWKCLLNSKFIYLRLVVSKCYLQKENRHKGTIVNVVAELRIMLKPNLESEEIVLGMSQFVPRNCVGLLALFLHSGTCLARQYQLRSWKSPFSIINL